MELANRLPELEPESMLDFGAGTGAAIWSGLETWGESLNSVQAVEAVSYTHLRAHETPEHLVCRLLLEKKKKKNKKNKSKHHKKNKKQNEKKINDQTFKKIKK
eukprot:TRINITY_DN24913_c0_g1_i2.p1 TRINITY_DN24913_c0_g1~~TRINITY_DN24913_c0_g1_i2.p1  ORF type:complete len:103 (+),score=32.20 TRINITY_DN24913_c0_g1_i2:81-389(+)